MLKVRVGAAPTDGDANKAVVRLLAKALGLPKSAVRITSGETGRLKRLEIETDTARIHETFGNPPDDQLL
jgi:uncharacterized protein